MLDPSKRRADGQSAERLAEHFLESKGFRPLASNYLTRFGEIDLIMDDRGTLVFIEVKRRRNEAYGEPEESVTVVKRRRIVRAALDYLRRWNYHDRLMRFDVVIVDLSGFRHITDAFDAGGWFSV